MEHVDRGSVIDVMLLSENRNGVGIPNTVSDTPSATVVIKRGRGRPRKFPPIISDSSSHLIHTTLSYKSSPKPRVDHDTCGREATETKCESCLNITTQLFKFGKLQLCKDCETLMRSVAGNSRQRSRQANVNPSLNTTTCVEASPFLEIKTKLGQNADRLQEKSMGQSERAQDTFASNRPAGPTQTKGNALKQGPVEDAIKNVAATPIEFTEPLPKKRGRKPTRLHSKIASSSVALTALEGDFNPSVLSKAALPQFYSSFPSSLKRSEQARNSKSQALYDRNKNDRPTNSFSNSTKDDNMTSCGSITEALSNFHTTGAFLTRTASKLLGGQAVKSVDFNIHGYAQGRAVKVLNIDGTWYFGSMVNLENGRIKIHFDGWGSEWDEWIASDSRRLKVLTEEETKQRETMLYELEKESTMGELSNHSPALHPPSKEASSNANVRSTVGMGPTFVTKKYGKKVLQPGSRKTLSTKDDALLSLFTDPAGQISSVEPALDRSRVSVKAKQSKRFCDPLTKTASSMPTCYPVQKNKNEFNISAPIPASLVPLTRQDGTSNREMLMPPATQRKVQSQDNMTTCVEKRKSSAAQRKFKLSLDQSAVQREGFTNLEDQFATLSVQSSVFEFPTLTSDMGLSEHDQTTMNYGDANITTSSLSSISFSSDELSDPSSTPLSMGSPKEVDSAHYKSLDIGSLEQEDNNEHCKALTCPSPKTLGNPIHLGLLPMEVTEFVYQDEEQAILSVIHRVLDTGLVINRVVEYSPESFDLAEHRKRRKKKKKTPSPLKEDDQAKKDGKECSSSSNEDDGNSTCNDDNEPLQRTFKRTRDRFANILEARLGTRLDHPIESVVKKDAQELQEARRLAMRNMSSTPLFLFERQIVYNEADRSNALNNKYEVRKKKLERALSMRKFAKQRRFVPLSTRILGVSNASNVLGITFNEAGHIETATTGKNHGAVKAQQKATKKRKGSRFPKVISDPNLSDDENSTDKRKIFQTLRSLTRTKKRKRLLAEDHISFLRRKMVPGTRIRARDRQMDWLTGIIRDVRNSRVLVHYEGYQEFFNEWIDINSERLRYDPSLEQNQPAQTDQGTIEPTKLNTKLNKVKESPGCLISSNQKEEGMSGQHSASSDPKGEATMSSLSSEPSVIQVHCVQCQVKISQFRIYCMYCEVEAKMPDTTRKPFNLCLWCFSNAFPETHDHPRSSFATKVIVGPRGVHPVKGGIITRFEQDFLDLEFNEADLPNPLAASATHTGGSIASTNRYGITKKKRFWAHDICARHSPEVIQGKDGSWYNVSVAMRRGRTVRCSACREKGATIGCFDPKCGKSFHVPCTGKPMSHFEDGVIFWCSQHEKDILRRDAYDETFSCDKCAKILGVNPWKTCVKCSDDYFQTYDLCQECFSADNVCHEHPKEDFRTTSLEIMYNEQVERESAQVLEQDEMTATKKKTTSYKPKMKSISRMVCSYCWSPTSNKWRKGYNGVLMCEDCFLAGPLNEVPMQPPLCIEGSSGIPTSTLSISVSSASETSHRGVGTYATSAEDYSHSPYLTRTAVSAERFDHSSSQAVYLDSYGPAENQLYSLPIDTTYYDIPGRAPRWATHSGTDYHGTWLPQTVRRAVTKYTRPNEKILSNFLGRGTDAIECFLLGR
ncbi:hypothetical protein BX616_001415, partial [Lobosporangium transversale]